MLCAGQRGATLPSRCVWLRLAGSAPEHALAQDRRPSRV